MYTPPILTTPLHLILICWTINALRGAWLMDNFWEYLARKWRKIHHSWYSHQYLLGALMGTGGGNWRNEKVGKAEIPCLFQKGPGKSRTDSKHPGSQQEHGHFCHSFIQHSLASGFNTECKCLGKMFQLVSTFLTFSGKLTSRKINRVSALR